MHKESCSDISIVETGGYLTTQQLVEGMVQSGQRLADFRNMMFDADVNLSEDELLDSPVLSEGDDIVDVTRRAGEARRSMADTAAKASQTAQEGRPEPVPGACGRRTCPCTWCLAIFPLVMNIAR